MTTERLEERGRALFRLLAAGESLNRLRALDVCVRGGAYSDWPQRPRGRPGGPGEFRWGERPVWLPPEEGV